MGKKLKTENNLRQTNIIFQYLHSEWRDERFRNVPGPWKVKSKWVQPDNMSWIRVLSCVDKPDLWRQTAKFQNH
jgi:hypothetical protein